MDNQGWIKLHRSILESAALFGKSHDFAIFVYLITLADRRTGIARVGRLKIAKLFRIKDSNVYKVMKRLEAGNYINIKSNNQYSEIYICNYDKYQGQSNNESNNKVTTKEQQSNTKQEVRSKNNIYNQQADRDLISIFGMEPPKPKNFNHWQLMAVEYAEKLGFKPSPSWFKFFKEGSVGKLQDTFAKMSGIRPLDPEKYFYKLYGGKNDTSNNK